MIEPVLAPMFPPMDASRVFQAEGALPEARGGAAEGQGLHAARSSLFPQPERRIHAPS